MRIFISIDIPQEIKKIVKEIQKNLPEFNGKKIEEENFHLTLKFLGEITEKDLDETKQKLSEINFKKFKAKLGDLGVFSENFVRIVWIKIENCDGLQKEIDEKLSSVFPKEKRFMSHLTIARIKSLKNKGAFLEGLKKINYERKDFSVDKFFLNMSILTKERAFYKRLENFFLE